MTTMTVTGALVEARPTATEVAIVYVPAGSVVRVHHQAEVQEYALPLLEVPWYAVIPGDRDVIGWGAVPCWYGSLAGVRNGHHQLDRKAWPAAARALASCGVVYVQYQRIDHHGKQRWTAVSHRVEAVSLSSAELEVSA
ncbi:hypothetical protein AB0395_32740 [Streptosporangium sp. NPDC051023]|uniref:hypothetical protein n=1 Tax=Streptosporangium sp. NPDC051023 TaxID=3155410 RepID=UPI0034502EC8